MSEVIPPVVEIPRCPFCHAENLPNASEVIEVIRPWTGRYFCAVCSRTFEIVAKVLPPS